MNFTNLKFALLFSLSSFTLIVKSEIVPVKLFYDKDWVICKSATASYYRLCGWDNEKQFFEGDFADFLLNDTKIVEGKYIQGKKNGSFVFYFESGTLKIKGFFKEDNPLDLWSWYYPNEQLNYSIKFELNDFHFIEINDENGKSLLNMKYEFTYNFQNDRLNPNMQIMGIVDNKMKEGNWLILNNNKTLGYDTFKKDRYIKTVLDNDIQSQNKRILSSSIFIPYSIFACESLNFNSDIFEDDYPFLSYLLPPSWKQIDAALGIIGDSLIFQIEKKPMYIGGMDGLNKAIMSNIRFTWEYFENCSKYGYAYFEIVIDENGDVINKSIISSPDKLITDIAMESLNSIQQFKPAYNNGTPIKSKLTSRIKFEKPRMKM